MGLGSATDTFTFTHKKSVIQVNAVYTVVFSSLKHTAELERA